MDWSSAGKAREKTGEKSVINLENEEEKPGNAHGHHRI
jgi:hypothetical protein